MQTHGTVRFRTSLYLITIVQLINLLILEADGSPVKFRNTGPYRANPFLTQRRAAPKAIYNRRFFLPFSAQVPKHELKYRIKDDFRRALDIHLKVQTPEPKAMDDFESELFDILKDHNNGSDEIQRLNHTCLHCLEKELDSGTLKPAYPCDEWDSKSRTCWLNRNIGDTVTFILSFGVSRERIPKVVWRQEFHVHGKGARKQFVLRRESPMWNIVIGSGGHEMRVSPITEMDVNYNLFSATPSGSDGLSTRATESKVIFRIRLIPNDLGFVYPGETLVLNMESYITLPLESMKYVWYMEKDGELGSLPSNMKSSPSGRVLTISELRKEQEGIMACAVYTNFDILVAKKRFLIKEISPNEVLMRAPSQKTPPRGRVYPRNIYQQSILKRKNRRVEVEDKINSVYRQLEYGKYDEKEKDDDHTEGFEVDSNEEESPWLNEDISLSGKLFDSPKKYSNKPSNQYSSNTAFLNRGFKQQPVQLPPPTSVVKMDSILQELESRKTTTSLADVDYDLQEKAQAIGKEKDGGSEKFESNLMKSSLPVSAILVTEATVVENLTPNPKEYPSESITASHDDSSFVLAEEKEAKSSEPRPEDDVSKMLAECHTDKQCSGHGTCIKQQGQSPGFCRCLPNYHGNGISCWEDIISGKSRILPVDKCQNENDTDFVSNQSVSLNSDFEE